MIKINSTKDVQGCVYYLDLRLLTLLKHESIETFTHMVILISMTTTNATNCY